MSALPSLRTVHPRTAETFSTPRAASAFIAFYLKVWPPEAFGTICLTYPKTDGRVTVRCLRADAIA